MSFSNRLLQFMGAPGVGGATQTRAGALGASVLLVIDALTCLPFDEPYLRGWYLLAQALNLLVLGVVFAATSRGDVSERFAEVISVSYVAVAGIALVYPPSQAHPLMMAGAFWMGLYLTRPWLPVLIAIPLALTPAFVLGDATERARLLVLFLCATGLCLASVTIAVRFRRSVRHLTLTRQQRDSVLDSVDVGLMLIKPDGHVELVNPAYQRLMETGSNGRALARIGHDPQLFARRGRQPLTPDELPSARVSRGEEFDGEVFWLGAGDEARAVSISARRLSQTEPERGSLIVYSDVTELMRALSARDGFVASVSHELRTPLTAILGYVEFILESESMPEERADHLRRVYANGIRLNRLVEDLLLSATTPTLRPERMNLAELAATVADLTEVRGERAGIRVTAHAGEAWVDGDQARLGQVVEKLVANGIKYNEPGGEVLLSTWAGRTDAVIEVRDNGSGMSVPDQEAIFEREFRDDSGSTAAITGVGLGLSVCRDIVRAHGGHISVTSSPGIGTAFTITLPAQPAPGAWEVVDRGSEITVPERRRPQN